MCVVKTEVFELLEGKGMGGFDAVGAVLKNGAKYTPIGADVLTVVEEDFLAREGGVGNQG